MSSGTKSFREYHGKRRNNIHQHGSAGSPGPSTSGTSNQVSLPVTADLASLFECPVCFDYVLPPILQCPSGHLVCSNCRPKLSCCPTCRGPLGNIRNLAMEKVASSVMFLCKYSTSGCTVSLLHNEKPQHEEVCEYRPYSCPCPGASCKWQGSLDQVMPHLLISHKSITTLQGEDIVFLVTDINLPGAVDWVMMQSCFGHHFMLVLEKQEKFPGHQQFFAIVQLIGSRKQAEVFAYRLELNGHRRRLTWEATPRSIHEGISSAILTSDCLVFDTSIVQLFEDNGNLGINVTISMVSETSSTNSTSVPKTISNNLKDRKSVKVTCYVTTTDISRDNSLANNNEDNSLVDNNGDNSAVNSDEYMDSDSIEEEQIEDNNLEDNNMEDNNLEDNNLEDNNLEDNNLEDNNLEDNNLEDNNFEENNFEENYFEENNFEDNNFEENFEDNFEENFEDNFEENFEDNFEENFEDNNFEDDQTENNSPEGNYADNHNDNYYDLNYYIDHNYVGRNTFLGFNHYFGGNPLDAFNLPNSYYYAGNNSGVAGNNCNPGVSRSNVGGNNSNVAGNNYVSGNDFMGGYNNIGGHSNVSGNNNVGGHNNGGNGHFNNLAGTTFSVGGQQFVFDSNNIPRRVYVDGSDNSGQNRDINHEAICNMLDHHNNTRHIFKDVLDVLHGRVSPETQRRCWEDENFKERWMQCLENDYEYFDNFE